MPDLTVHEVLVRADQILSDEGKWCQNSTARDAAGRPCRENAPEARQWCLVGAAWKAATELGWPVMAGGAFKAMDVIAGEGWDTVSFNNAAATKFDDVKGLLAKAIAATSGEG